MNNKSAALTALAFILLVSCHNGNKPGTGQQTSADSINMKEISKDIKSVVYPLPTPFEMTQMLNDIGAKYNSSILNPADKVDKYFKEKNKALNIGIYSADLAYSATYDQKQDVKIFSKTLKTLIDQLGISIDYSTMLSDEFREKVNNKDTLIKVITNTFYDTYKFLDERSNPDLALMMVSGIWIELMYIATNISEDSYHVTGMVRIIVQQKDSYQKLINLLQAHESDSDIKELETKLLVLKPVFDKVENGLTEKDYILILKTIQSVRKSIVF